MPRPNSTIVHPRMAASLEEEFMLDTVTIQEATVVVQPSGGVSHTWAEVSGLLDVRCQVAPGTGKSKMYLPQMIRDEVTHQIVIPEAHPEITTAMQVVDHDGVILAILDVRVDSQDTQTSIACRKVTT